MNMRQIRARGQRVDKVSLADIQAMYLRRAYGPGSMFHTLIKMGDFDTIRNVYGEGGVSLAREIAEKCEI